MSIVRMNELKRIKQMSTKSISRKINYFQCIGFIIAVRLCLCVMLFVCEHDLGMCWLSRWSFTGPMDANILRISCIPHLIVTPDIRLYGSVIRAYCIGMQWIKGKWQATSTFSFDLETSSFISIGISWFSQCGFYVWLREPKIALKLCTLDIESMLANKKLHFGAKSWGFR